MQQVVANNLANANTDAFKVDRVTARVYDGGESPVPVQETDFQQGTLRETGRTLDLALEGEGFFVVQTENGERLTRGGSFRLDAGGQLIDSLGAPVLGKEGPVVIAGGTVEVLSDGAVMVDGALLDSLRIETVEDLSSLMKEGTGRYLASGATEAPAVGQTEIMQGYVEEANLDPVTSMVELVKIQHSYKANVDALQAMDAVLSAIANDVGTV
jgi:flagellar basal-body rod protein FlgG